MDKEAQEESVEAVQGVRGLQQKDVRYDMFFLLRGSEMRWGAITQMTPSRLQSSSSGLLTRMAPHRNPEYRSEWHRWPYRIVLHRNPLSSPSLVGTTYSFGRL